MSRRVQGRINELSLVMATAAERNPDGTYTEDALRLLKKMSRLVHFDSTTTTTTIT